MSDEKVNLEVTNCIRMESGNVAFSPSRGRAVFAVASGLLIAVASLLALIFGASGEVLIGLFIGGGLAYLGVRALRAPMISIEVDQRIIQSRSSSSQSPQTWSFDALEHVEGLPSGTGEKESGIVLLQVSLQFKDGESLPLFTTADVKKASKVGHWLDAAFGAKV